MKITRDKMFFSKDLIHTLAYVGMFVAAIISVEACKSGIWVAAILAWIVAGIIIGLAIISDYKKAELLKNGTRIIGKVTATKRVHIKFHMISSSTPPYGLCGRKHSFSARNNFHYSQSEIIPVIDSFYNLFKR